ncbi:hypothetical protein EYF80_031905 [Liparis tanakae]|uniref:Uncharacterized protein n=1 Tax=Liparis tanakae TaxID=230148 RepID=A0A4Z2GWL0_9TELE|nr:hypothetical protein EYF80_031905 [Liparis tanakae]
MADALNNCHRCHDNQPKGGLGFRERNAFISGSNPQEGQFIGYACSIPMIYFLLQSFGTADSSP